MFVRKLARVTCLIMLMISIITLTGCLYPDDQSPGGDVSARESVLTVQDAVDRYWEQGGLLPIQNSNADVPLYEKYKVDFGKLKRMSFISQIPSAAFENGGSYQFLIIDEETKPLVKLLDLVMFQAVVGVQKQVNEYRSKHSNQNPKGAEIYPGFHTIDFDELGTDGPEIISMYSKQTLTLLMNEQGRVFVDYGIDIATAIKKSEVLLKQGEDLRRVLIEASYFVPVRSPVYQLVDNEPMAVTIE